MFASLALVVWMAPPAVVSRCAEVSFTPAPKLQLVGWIETASGDFVDTVYITQQTGRFGLGNRPGRFDFNSGPMFPYGRRTPTFPVWAHRHGRSFPAVIFQSSPEDPAVCDTLVNDPTQPQGDQREFADCGENNLSHSFSDSSTEKHYCAPLTPDDPKWLQAEALTCATSAFTDKGRLSTVATSKYPPRADLTLLEGDLPSVELYRMMNPFDTVSQATPVGGLTAEVAWPVPESLPDGDYVLYVEAALERDHNDTYSVAAYPPLAPNGPKGISWAGYGVPYRGQPSVVYRVPFAIAPSLTEASTASYVGYGDPNGADGAVRPPDATITSDTPGSGALRLQLVSEGADMYRLRVRVRPNLEGVLPGTPELLSARETTTTRVTMSFIAPGMGGTRVAGYDVRILANTPITADNFGDAVPITTSVAPDEPGALQMFDVMGLLPETEYSIGVRAYDGCRNPGELAVLTFLTADREAGHVDACFVATAAYGSVMANDVELLRHARDSLLARSVLGELAIETYYTFGPAVAGVVGESDVLRRSARGALAPLIAWVRGLRF